MLIYGYNRKKATAVYAVSGFIFYLDYLHCNFKVWAVGWYLLWSS